MDRKVLFVLGVLLILVIGVQSYYLMSLSGQVDTLSRKIPKDAGSAAGQSLLAPNSPDPFMPRNRDNWNPFEQMQRMQNEMNKIFGDMRSQLHNSPDFDALVQPFSFSPSVDIKEEDDRYIVTADIPGSDESRISVNLEGNKLRISASTKKEQQQKNGVLRSERFMGTFERVVTLPLPVLAEKMTTDYKDGVLTIVIPKSVS